MLQAPEQPAADQQSSKSRKRANMGPVIEQKLDKYTPKLREEVRKDLDSYPGSRTIAKKPSEEHVSKLVPTVDADKKQAKESISPAVQFMPQELKPGSKKNIIESLRDSIKNGIDRVRGWFGLRSNEGVRSTRKPLSIINGQITVDEAIQAICVSVCKDCDDNIKAERLRDHLSKCAKQLSTAELQILFNAIINGDYKHNFNKDGRKGPGFYQDEGVKCDIWDKRNERSLDYIGNPDMFALGHELMHAADLMAGEVDKKSKNAERIPATSVSPIKEKLYGAVLKDIKIFFKEALGRELSDHDITNPSAELVEEYQRYLQNHWHSDTHRFYVHIFVDVLGFYSKGKITAPVDYKQHTKKTFDECKNLESSRPDIFIEAGNSELLAGIFGARLRGHKGMFRALTYLFPNVSNEYEGIINQIAKKSSDYEFTEGDGSYMSFADLSDKEEWWKDPEEYRRRRDELFAMMDREEREMPPEQKAFFEEKKRERERILEARDKYVAAGLGEPMEHGFDLGPYAALKYPGGPVAVYEEAIRRGVTWEEVCDYTTPPYMHGFID